MLSVRLVVGGTVTSNTTATCLPVMFCPTSSGAGAGVEATETYAFAAPRLSEVCRRRVVIASSMIFFVTGSNVARANIFA